MKTQITITYQVSFLAEVPPQQAEDFARFLQCNEHSPAPGFTGYKLAIESMVGLVQLQEQATEVNVQPACRVCGCTEDNCEKCIQAQGHACHWVEEDLCSRCAETFTSPDKAQTTEL
jgi:hypothetical protein